MKVGFNNKALILADPSFGLEHNFDCTSLPSSIFCKDYNTNDPRYLNKILTESINTFNISKDDYSYAIIGCTGSYDKCSMLLPGSTIGFGFMNV
jgi:hypothetical protein